MVYLEQLECSLLNQSSDRELALYRFLEGRVHSFVPKPNDLEDELCSKVFASEDAEIELTKLQRMKPFKGFHYSNNLITQIAAAIVSEEREKSNIASYLNSHSFRDLYVFNHALSKDFYLELKANNSIDRLAQKLLTKDKINKDDIGNCVTEINDLFDLFIVKQAIALSCLQYNQSENINTYKQLGIIQRKLTNRLNLFFSILGSLLFCWFLTLITPYIVTYATKNWNILEPLAYLLDKILLIVGFFGAFTFIKSDTAKKTFMRHFYSLCYRSLGINYNELTSLNNELKDK
ncbi:hypothetical protein J3L11_08405 [Shewanella sp. 4t3-1-2LB]|uniref:hypothetical protein n=1 Tax=Shewanella sp. 4t3-1-2LB TaxID=2817682 RepID=UPI001A99CEFA|nr:hypothetical protein [Shewanella sp. 4t3-1-2LB]MBO1271661.1 hypothetical protein [Shewanella sp. 4t3-1-2LB]